MPQQFNRDLIKKLLQLFPVKSLKDHFQQPGNREEIIEILSALGTNPIFNYVLTHHGLTKQNIYLYKLQYAFVENVVMPNLPLDVHESSFADGKNSYLYLPEVTYSVYLSNPITKEEIKFLQPVLLEIVNDTLIIKFTKIEKNISSYYKSDREPRLVYTPQTEEETLNAIIAHFQTFGLVEKVDFNKGIKVVWENDEFDCRKVSYLDAAATTVITMHENLTFKEEKPDEYKKMKDAPIGNSIWKNKSGENIMEIFVCSPSDGTISINKYSDDTTQIINVITKILSQN